MIEGSWLCLVLVVLPNLKRHKKDKLFFDEQGMQVFISKKCSNNFFCQ